MRILYVLMGIIQFSFAFHAVKTGRGAMWVTIILVFPVLGCLAYYFFEVFPRSREERSLRRHVRDIAKALNPDGDLQRRTEDLAQTASVDNRLKLADECLERGMFDEAIRLYEGCLEGPHAGDPAILFSCARARFYNGDMRQAEEILSRLEKAHPKHRADEVLLLRARVNEALGDTQRALNAYEALRNRYVGFEAKYRYGMLLDRLGRANEAQELFAFIGANARRSAVESEREWVKLAAKEREKVAA
ncbi:MAG TPA: tetratricopeptide repeat protein [Usitatibacter sp.]|nr:tetratricopeptide repeat protein [Usitatibacter sp.]